MNPTALPPAIALMGPTASGKTRLSIQLAQQLNGEIISVDSAMVYRGMDIGTAKPSLEEREGVPHHLIDLLDPAEAFSTGQFRQNALSLMDEISQRGRLPILVGGTLLYFNALFHGLAELPSADAAIRQEIDEQAEKLGWARLHEELARVDPVSAARVHPNDPQRIQRALEIYRVSGIPWSELCKKSNNDPLPFQLIPLVLTPQNREVLHGLIKQRFQLMLQQGLVEEVRRLYERGDLNPQLPAIRAVGYRQVWSYLAGELEYGEMVERGIIATRQFAKRQYTWLRRETGAIPLESEDPHLLATACSHLAARLRST